MAGGKNPNEVSEKELLRRLQAMSKEELDALGEPPSLPGQQQAPQGMTPEQLLEQMKQAFAQGDEAGVFSSTSPPADEGTSQDTEADRQRRAQLAKVVQIEELAGPPPVTPMPAGPVGQGVTGSGNLEQQLSMIQALLSDIHSVLVQE